MKQQTLAVSADQGAGFEQHRRVTRREEFLKTMNEIVPWAELCAVIEPYYPKKGNGRAPIGLERMLRIHFMQHWFNMADFACEEALYDIPVLRQFARIDLGSERVPDATTILKFRRLLEQHQLNERLFGEVGQALQRARITIKSGTIVDATIISAPSSTKNEEKQRDLEMKQTRKGKQWHFGMKLHIGVDSESGLAHSAVVTSANIHDKHALPDLLHGYERSVYGDSAYHGQQETIERISPLAQDCANERTRKRGGEVDEVKRASNREKSKVRSRVEHVFGVIKRLWGFNKVRYRGLAKNAGRAFVALALANLYLARKQLVGQVCLQ